MWWLVTCLLAAALQSCVNGDGTHYKEGEKVRCAADDDDDDDDDDDGVCADYCVREQGGAVLQPTGDLPLLLSACLQTQQSAAPFSNEFSLVTAPPQVQHASLSLGEVLAGDRKAVSDYSIGFLESFDEKTLCTVELGQEEVDILREAIEDLYYFEFVFGERETVGM